MERAYGASITPEQLRIINERKEQLKMPKAGSRVGVVLSSDEKKKEIRFFGYGEYLGDLPCPAMGGFKNPCIKLDSNGKHVWGCQIWWGDEEEMKGYIQRREAEGFSIVPVKDEEFTYVDPESVVLAAAE
jgi:hypothetical protein